MYYKDWYFGEIRIVDRKKINALFDTYIRSDGWWDGDPEAEWEFWQLAKDGEIVAVPYK